MKLAYFRKSLKPLILRACVAFLLITVLAACGINPATTSSPAQPHASNTASKPANTTPSLHLNTANINVKQGDLLIQSRGGLQCPSIPGAGAIPGQLVFNSDPATYSQAEIAQIRTYVNSNFLTSPPPLPPPTLRWVLGGSIDVVPGETGGGPGSSDCGVILTLTNTGNTPIQIPKAGVQLKARPQQNAYQYHLINVCSLWPLSKTTGAGICPPTSGGGGACSYYDTSIQLGLGEKNTVFSAVPSASNGRGGPPCGALTLASAAQDTLTFSFSLAPNIAGNMIYSVAPVFTIDTAQGEQTLVLAQLGSTLAFAGGNQFSCYGLQGTSFALEQSPFSGPTWCI